MYSITQKYLTKILKLNRQKILWYKLSLIVVGGIIFLIYDYDYIVKQHLERYFLFAGLIVSAVWWYWTMGVFSTLFAIKNYQLKLMDEILEGIKDIKKDIKTD